jgi:hypothetical protein
VSDHGPSDPRTAWNVSPPFCGGRTYYHHSTLTDLSLRIGSKQVCGNEQKTFRSKTDFIGADARSPSTVRARLGESMIGGACDNEGAKLPVTSQNKRCPSARSVNLRKHRSSCSQWECRIRDVARQAVTRRSTSTDRPMMTIALRHTPTKTAAKSELLLLPMRGRVCE